MTGISPDLGRVRVRLFWWGGTAGRLVLIRTVDRHSVSRCEVWWSAPTGVEQAAAAKLIITPAQWRRLLSGLPVTKADLPIPLYRVSEEDDADDRAAMGQALHHPDFHLLTSMHTVVHTDAAQTAIVAADRPVITAHRLASPFHGLLVANADTFAGLSARAPAARTAYDVTLTDVRGVMIGDDNLQINRFDITVTNAELNLDGVLARERVREAIANVTMNPADENRRTELIDALTHPGWFVTWRPAHLTVTDPGREQSQGFLASLLGFTFGVMAGDGNRQTNQFTYVTSSLPDAQSLLTDNPPLARAIAALICPAGVVATRRPCWTSSTRRWNGWTSTSPTVVATP